jgi:hypothetical protein
MKKLTGFVLALLLPIVALAQDAKPSAIVSTYRVWVKDGHTDAFKKAIAEHAKKYHTGKWKWRVNEVLTGPDTGAYMIVEGPNTWTDNEDRGDLGKEHNKHYDKALTPHIEKSSAQMYAKYEAEMSTTPAANWSNKVLLTHHFPKGGRIEALSNTYKLYKPVWEKLGWNVVAWSSVASGAPQITLARRLKSGFKDFDVDGPSFKKTFDEIHGAGTYDKTQEDYGRNASDMRFGEMIEFKPDLSSQ